MKITIPIMLNNIHIMSVLPTFIKNDLNKNRKSFEIHQHTSICYVHNNC